jgi:antitoxin (DNA-binding transcriptional repressor) of toxin-antitoxin stability system
MIASMTRIDLDDLPPKLAQILAGVGEGEEVILVRDGAVVARLTGGAPLTAAGEEPTAPPDDQRVHEVFEQFRSSIEDEF